MQQGRTVIQEQGVISVSIIIPTLNEAENIDLLLKRIFSVAELKSYQLEVVFSDGCSQDDTCNKVKAWQSEYPVRLLESDRNRGLSAAVITGAIAASGEYAVVMDADLSHPPEKIPELLGPVVSGEYEMLIGSRYTKGGDTPDWPLSRKLSSLFATLPARLFADVKDPLAGFFCVRRERLANLGREVIGFKIGLELLATEEQPFRAAEVPILFHDRCYGDSKMGITVVLDYFHQLLLLVGIDFHHAVKGIQVIMFVALLALVDFSIAKGLTLFSQPLQIASGVSWFVTVFIAVVAWKVRYSLETHSRTVKRQLVALIYGGFLLWILRSGVVVYFPAAASGATLLFCISILSWICAYLASVCFVFSLGKKRISGELVVRFYALGAVLYLLVLRIVYFSIVPITTIEADFLREAFTDAEMFNGVLGMRWVALFVWLFTVVCVFNFTRDVRDRSSAFKAVLLSSILPFTFLPTFFFSWYTIHLLLWSGSVYMLYRLLVVGARTAWLYAGILPVFAAANTPFAGILLVAALVYVIMFGAQIAWLKKRKVLHWGAVGMVTALTVTLYGGPISWRESYSGFTWINATANMEITSNPLLVLLMVTPMPLAAVLLCCVKSLKGEGITSYPYTGFFTQENQRFFTLFLILPLLVGVVASVVTGNYSYCSGVVWIASLPAISLTFSSTGGASSQKADDLIYKGWWVTIVVLIPLYGLFLMQLA